MRRPLERLARLLADEPGTATLGELAVKYGETTERIADAMDANKMRRGVPTTLPPVEWGTDKVVLSIACMLYRHQRCDGPPCPCECHAQPEPHL